MTIHQTFAQDLVPNNARPNAAAKVADVLRQIDLREVKVGGEFGRRMDLTITGNLLAINVDKDFLAPFGGGKYTGMNDGSGPFVGLGKTLEGMVRLAACSGNEALVARKKYVLETLLKQQETNGYVGIMPADKRTWTLWDVHEQGFIIMALLTDYRLFENQNALAAARKLGDYLIQRWPGKPADWEQKLPKIKEYFAEIGLNHSFLALYAATRDPRYLDFAANELGTEKWNLDIVIGRHPPIDGHSYMYLSHCLAQLELYRLRPDAKVLAPTRRAVEFMTRKDGMTITGGVGQFECWTDNQDGRKELGETCSTTYQTFVCDSLLRLEGDARNGDLMERMLYNAAFGAQSPDGRRIRYYTPFEGKRVYFGPDSYCCPGNFRRLMGFLPQLIYYRAGNGLAVNLYTDSQATLDEIGGTTVAIRQETDYPSTGRVTVHIEPQRAAAFPLLLRLPRWCSQAKAEVNGKPIATAIKPGEFLKIDRTWNPGDRVTLDMSMPWRYVTGRKVQAGCAAVMRGPLIYSLAPLKTPALAGMDLKRLVLLPGTAELVTDNSVRPGGTACRIKADLDKADKGAFSVTLTEFPDPDGQAIYFQLSDPKVAMDDELLVTINKR